MTITAKVIADSISSQDIRLTTLQLRYPRMIHSEWMTHRAFSRNASSSRAIPVERLIQDVLDDPAMPVFWGKNQPGMQASEEMAGEDREAAIELWLEARDYAVDEARWLSRLGAHKQLVNRLIEPWCHINVVVTATEWANFFALRRHAGAQPEMRALAEAVWEAREASLPALLHPGEWHLPYVDRYDDDLQDEVFSSVWKRHKAGEFSEGACDELHDRELIKISVARCARVSYLTHEGKPPNVADDLKLYERLVGSEPLHASPAEHQATPDERTTHRTHGTAVGWLRPEEHGNLHGWRQYRKMLPNENVRDR